MSSVQNKDSRLYVGNLPPDIRNRDVEDLFYKFGKIAFIDLKNNRDCRDNRRGPPFAFVEFDDPRDAEDAVRKRNGYDYDGYPLRVEFSTGKDTRGDGSSSRGGGGYGMRGGRGGGRGGRGGPPSRRSDYRVLVSGLPPTGSWQDLKDHMREAGDVCYADVFKDGTGVVEFLKMDDMKYAAKKLDDSKFRSHEGETGYMRVKVDDNKSGFGGTSRRSRSPSFSPPRRTRASPSYSPMRHHSPY